MGQEVDAMNVSLTPQLEKMIQKEIRSGRYSSASEVVRDALRLFLERKKDREQNLTELRREIKKGIDQLDRGEGVPFDDKLVEKVKLEGRRRLTRRKNGQSS